MRCRPPHRVAALVDEGRAPDPIPVVGAQAVVVQVVDADLGIRAASASSDRLKSLLSADELRRGQVR